MAVTINSDVEDGKHFEIVLDKTGVDTGTINVKTWNDGTTHTTQPSDSEQPFSIISIKAKADGSKLTCKADLFLFDPPVIVAITPPKTNQAAVVSVAVFGSTQTYEVSQADFNKVKTFISGSGFPALT